MPFANLVNCSYPGCRALVQKGRCEQHKREQQRRRGSAEDKRFYDSSLWQRVRETKLQRDPLCQYCLLAEQLTPASEVDHYRSLEQGGHRTADANLVSACKSCHSSKTRAEQLGEPAPPYAPSAEPRYTFA